MLSIIVKRKDILGGVPVIRGTRVPVSAVASAWINLDKPSTAKVQEVYPDLTDKEIQGAKNYLQKKLAS